MEFRNSVRGALAAAAISLGSTGGLTAAHAASFDERFETIKDEASDEQLYRLLYDLPKGGDIHNHLGGSSRAEWWFDLAVDTERNGGYVYYTKTAIEDCPGPRAEPVDPRNPYLIYFHTIQESTYEDLSDCQKAEYEPMAGLDDEERRMWLNSLRLDKEGEGRYEFFEKTWRRIGELFRNPVITTELLVENMKRFGDEGVRYLELQTGADGFVTPDGEPIPVERGVQHYEDRLAERDAIDTGVTVRFLYTVLRFKPDAEQDLRDAYAFVDAHERWVGINMAGREDNDKGHPLRFLDTYREMRRKYSDVRLSIHAGEVDEPSKHVRQTLLLGAERIGHGVDLITDPDTMLLMREGPYLVEIQLISNQLLEYTEDLSRHPFPEYLRTGIPVNLNTDDRGMWDSNMTDEYFTAVKHFDLSWQEVVQLGYNSLKHSFAPEPVKQRMLEDYAREVAAFERRYGGDDWRRPLEAVEAETYTYGEREFGISF
jgi:adenosine deaminase CECR1